METRVESHRPRKRAASADVELLAEHTEQLLCKLTRDELLERGQRLAQLSEDMAEHQVKAELQKKELKAQEARIAEEQSRLAAIVRAKAEPREVVVQEFADYLRGSYYRRRTDTHEVIPGSERPLRPEEKQGALPLVDRPGASRAMPPSLDEQRQAAQKELEQQADALLAKAPRKEQ